MKISTVSSRTRKSVSCIAVLWEFLSAVVVFSIVGSANSRPGAESHEHARLKGSNQQLSELTRDVQAHGHISTTMILWNTGFIETITPESLGNRGIWRITHYQEDPTQTPTSDYDLYDLDRDTLAPIRSVRNTEQYRLELNFGAHEVVVRRTSRHKTSQEKIQLTTAVEPEGPGLDVFVAALPLSVGYKTQYYIVDRWGGQGITRLKRVSLAVSKGSFIEETDFGKRQVYEIVIQPEDGSFKIRERVLADGAHFPVWVEYTRDGKTYSPSRVVALVTQRR